MRPQIIAELAAIFAERGDEKPSPDAIAPDEITTLRDALTWTGVRDNPLAVAKICRTLRALRVNHDHFIFTTRENGGSFPV